MNIVIGATEISTADAITAVMSDEQLESRILEVVNAELGYQEDRGRKALAEQAMAVADKQYAAFVAAKSTDTKATILSKVEVTEVAK